MSSLATPTWPLPAAKNSGDMPGDCGDATWLCGGRTQLALQCGLRKVPALLMTPRALCADDLGSARARSARGAISSSRKHEGVPRVWCSDGGGIRVVSGSVCSGWATGSSCCSWGIASARPSWSASGSPSVEKLEAREGTLGIATSGPAGNSSGVRSSDQPPRVSASTSAPASRSTLATSAEPTNAARCRGVQSSISVAPASACASRRSWTTAAEPPTAARWSGSDLSPERHRGWALASRRLCSASGRPACAARWTACTLPGPPVVAASSAPAASSTGITTACPLREARCSGVSPSESRASTSARWSSSTAAALAPPLLDATWSGDSPCWVLASKLAPSASSEAAASAWPAPAARWRGVCLS
mmetsp:Transcript_41972/g.125586  ORF Transcript_41972/g.125586 Transcript_41972/m.125586 type:complete len:362 (+) Transcript_41972:259-1344(+)